MTHLQPLKDLARLLLSAFRQPHGIKSRRISPHHLPSGSGLDMICFPIIDWEFRIQRPQHLMRQFAYSGRRCFYFRTDFYPWGTGARIWPLAHNLYNVQLPGPRKLVYYRDAITPSALKRFLTALDRLRLQTHIQSAVCKVDMPVWTPLALYAQSQWGWKIVYDCMDNHDGFSNNDSARLEQETRLMSASDLIVVASQALKEKALHTVSEERIRLIPNAADFHHFNKAPSVYPLTHLPRPIIGYYGAISDWFDVALVQAAAQAHPEWQFVLIGRTTGANVSSIQSLANVHLLGEISYEDLPAYLHQFDAACIPFIMNDLTRATSPVKFYEYLSAGKPVVSAQLPELEPFRALFYPYTSPGSFITQLEIALSDNSPEAVGARVKFAEENTWEIRYKALSQTFAETFGTGTWTRREGP